MLTKLNDFSWSQIDYHIEFLVYLNNYKDCSSFTHSSRAPVVGAAWKVTWPGLALHFSATVARSQGTVVVNVRNLAGAPCVWSLHMIWLPTPLCFTVLTCSPLSLELLRMLRLLMEGLLTWRISLLGANRPRGPGNPFQRRSYRCRQAWLPFVRIPPKREEGAPPEREEVTPREMDQSSPEAKKQSPTKEKVKVKERSSKKHLRESSCDHKPERDPERERDQEWDRRRDHCQDPDRDRPQERDHDHDYERDWEYYRHSRSYLSPVTDAPITVLRKMRLGKWLIGRSTRGGAAAIVVIGANSYFSLFQYGA